MNILISGHTDIGTTRQTNQDSVVIKSMNSPQGPIGFIALCDGMGGLSHGEIASNNVTHAFANWAETRLPLLWNTKLSQSVIRAEWTSIIHNQNEAIKQYGMANGIKLGTTATIILVTSQEYFVLNVGDSRAYEITENAVQITKDQTFVQREVDLGHLTMEEAEKDSRKNILLQCVGASDVVYPDFFTGKTAKDVTFLLCSDGFYHFTGKDVLKEMFSPAMLVNDVETIRTRIVQTVENVKLCGETDNITAAVIKISDNADNIYLDINDGEDTQSITTQLL